MREHRDGKLDGLSRHWSLTTGLCSNHYTTHLHSALEFTEPFLPSLERQEARGGGGGVESLETPRRSDIPMIHLNYLRHFKNKNQFIDLTITWAAHPGVKSYGVRADAANVLLSVFSIQCVHIACGTQIQCIGISILIKETPGSQMGRVEYWHQITGMCIMNKTYQKFILLKKNSANFRAPEWVAPQIHMSVCTVLIKTLKYHQIDP